MFDHDLRRAVRSAVEAFIGVAILANAVTATEQTPRHVKLLAIGNSFSGNATHYLPNIVEAAGDQLTFKHISIGGCPLGKHWTNANAFQHGATNADALAWIEAACADSMRSFMAASYRTTDRRRDSLDPDTSSWMR